MPKLKPFSIKDFGGKKDAVFIESTGEWEDDTGWRPAICPLCGEVSPHSYSMFVAVWYRCPKGCGDFGFMEPYWVREFRQMVRKPPSSIEIKRIMSMQKDGIYFAIKKLLGRLV